MKPRLRLVRTKANTPFQRWWAAAVVEFQRRGLAEPTFLPAHDAYDMGESPETWAAYCEGSDDPVATMRGRHAYAFEIG